MRVLVAGSRKGGVGKTNFCVQIGVASQHAGVRTAFVDLDPMAGLSKWWSRREAESPILVRAEPDLSAALKVCRKLGIGLVVVDTPPAVSQLVADAVGLADLVVVPCQASPDDLDGIEGTLELLAASPDTKAVFVMSRVKNRASMVMDVIAALSHHGAVCGQVLSDREDYKTSKIRGQSAAEFRKYKGLAAEEVAALWNQISQYLDLGVGNGSATVDQRDGASGAAEGAAAAAGAGGAAKGAGAGAGGNAAGGARGTSAAGEGCKPPASAHKAAAGRRPARPVSA
jgi:chromosome partitioning protein